MATLMSLQMRHKDAIMNVQLSHSAIHESLSPLGITADELRRLPGNRDVQLARARLLQDLCSRGLPTRRLESWHYTDLRTRLKAPSRPQAAEGAGDSGSLIPGSIVLQVNEAGCGMDAGIAGLSIRNYRHLLETDPRPASWSSALQMMLSAASTASWPIAACRSRSPAIIGSNVRSNCRCVARLIRALAW